MPRARYLIAALLAVVVLAAACGGGDDTDEEAPQTTAEVATGDRSQPGTTTVPDSAETPEAASEPEPEPEPEPVRLGDRFEWCAEVQAAFDEMADDQAAMAAAEAALQDAQTTLDAATDELDQVEARQVRDAAAERLDRLGNESGGSTSRAALWLRDRGFMGSDESRPIAFERALSAYHEAAAPDVAALLESSISLEYAPPPPLPGTALSFDISFWDDLSITLTPEEVLAAIAAYRAEAVPVAEDAIKAVADNWQAFQQAETTSGMLAAHTTLVEATIQARQAYEAASDARDDARTMPQEDRRRHADVFDAAEEAFQAVSGASSPLPVNFLALKGRIDALALADTAGMDAFWASLSESCEP